MEPEALGECAALAALGGRLVVPEAPLGTCLTEHGPRLYDYFLVHPDLAPHAEAQVVDLPHAPHVPVRLTIRRPRVQRYTR
eukprot:365499-Lingulodinium_polyedra.AAC.1